MRNITKNHKRLPLRAHRRQSSGMFPLTPTNMMGANEIILALIDGAYNPTHLTVPFIADLQPQFSKRDEQGDVMSTYLRSTSGSLFSTRPYVQFTVAQVLAYRLVHKFAYSPPNISPPSRQDGQDLAVVYGNVREGIIYKVHHPWRTRSPTY
jgi:hypothetical protein